MGLSEQLKGWDRIKAGGFTDSYVKVNDKGTLKVWVLSQDLPGEWKVGWMDMASMLQEQTDHVFNSLMTALNFAEQKLK